MKEKTSDYLCRKISSMKTLRARMYDLICDMKKQLHCADSDPCVLNVEADAIMEFIAERINFIERELNEARVDEVVQGEASRFMVERLEDRTQKFLKALRDEIDTRITHDWVASCHP